MSYRAEMSPPGREPPLRNLWSRESCHLPSVDQESGGPYEHPLANSRQIKGLSLGEEGCDRAVLGGVFAEGWCQPGFI